MNIYLAGPMQGYKDFNFPAFHRAAAELRKKGHTVLSPAEIDIGVLGEEAFKSETGDMREAIDKGFDLRAALYSDTKYICLYADAIALLPGWERSPGAQAEHRLAVALDLVIIYLITENTRLEQWRGTMAAALALNVEIRET
jgi:hypothetical protein